MRKEHTVSPAGWANLTIFFVLLIVGGIAIGPAVTLSIHFLLIQPVIAILVLVAAAGWVCAMVYLARNLHLTTAFQSTSSRD